MTSPPPQVPRHWLPSIPSIVFIGVLAFILLVFQEPLLNSDGDLPRHLRHGEWMLQHHALIRTDTFSYTMAGRPFVGFEYGSQLVYAAAHRTGGLAAVSVLAALCIAAAYALLARFMLRRGVEPLLAGATTGAAIVIGLGHWLARPHVFTLLAVPLLLELLLPAARWRIWPFAILFAAWANLHGGFVYGLGVIGLFLAAGILQALHEQLSLQRSTEVRRYAVALAVSATASLANPWGVGVYRHIVAMFGDHYIIDHTAEFASPDFHDLGTKLFLVVIVAVFVAAFASRRKADRVTVLVTAAGLYLALVQQRNAALFGLTALPLLAIHFDPDWRHFGLFRRARQSLAIGEAGAASALWIVPATMLALVLGVLHGAVRGRTVIADEFSRALMPVDAVAAARGAGLRGRVFSEFGWGGYLSYAWPEQKVFIDGGTDFYGGALMRDYGAIHDLRPGWLRLTQRWNLALVIVPPDAPIASELARDHGWTFWYCDPTAVVLVNPAAAASIAPRVSPRAVSCLPEAQRRRGDE